MGPATALEMGPPKKISANRKNDLRPQRKITVLPTGQQFAVVRMDPLAMVLHLNLDSVAIEEATAMKPKKYLVYVDSPQDLPFPQSQWCRYWVEPVATTLRPAVPEKGITSDMVLPIHPNTQYAKGRQPVVCTPQFPFPDCYFWIKSTMSLRVRTKRGAYVYDNDKAMTVSTRQHVAFMSAWNEDSRRMFALRRAYSPSPSGPTPVSDRKGRDSPPPQLVQRPGDHFPSSATPLSPPPLRLYRQESTSSDDEESSASQTSVDVEAATAPTLPPVPPLMEMAIDMDVFGWAADPKVPFIPLVDLWFELEDHLSRDDIPSPTELWREQETIGSIIEAALKRRATATAPPQAPPPPQGDSQKSQRPAVLPPHATDQSSRSGPSSEAHSSTSQGDEATHNCVNSTPLSRRPPSSIRILPETSRPMPTPRPDDSGLKEGGQVTPATSFASLLQSAKPLGHHVASWGFRSPLSSSPRHAPAPRSDFRPQLSTAPRLVAGNPGTGRLRANEAIRRHKADLLTGISHRTSSK